MIFQKYIKKENRIPIKELKDIKSKIISNKVSLPYIIEKLDISGDYMIKTTFNKHDNQVTITTEKIQVREINIKKDHTLQLTDELIEKITSDIKSGKIKVPYVISGSPDENGHKKEIIFTFKNGKYNRKTNTIQHKHIKYQIKKSVIYRRFNLKPFGRALNKDEQITSIGDPILFVLGEDSDPDKNDTEKEPHIIPIKGNTKLSFDAIFSKTYKSKTKYESKNKSKIKYKPRKKWKNSVCVTNILDDVTEDYLRELFSPYGKIKYIKILERRGGTKIYINYVLEQEALRAVEHMDKHRVGYCIINAEVC